MSYASMPTAPTTTGLATAGRRVATALARLSWMEAKLFLREPLGAFFSIAFPALLVLMLGSAMPGFTKPVAELGGLRPIDAYLPVVLALAIGTVAMVTLLPTLVTSRERGILRRLSATPVTPIALLCAQMVVNVAALIAGVALALGTAWLAFDVVWPANVAGLLLAFVLGSTAMVSVGLFVAAISPSTSASVGIGSLVYYPMLFAAGVWTPGPAMPDAVRRIADYTPLGAASQAMQDAWAGQWPSLLHVMVMLAFTGGFAALAARFFRWE
ncbi:ABC transporter permease [Melissospora conviva]|uniref:ABC transporter permease n=1 Tax=Melissospora conviva TaxID=3388432 RepID=UPI003C173903